ncbi:hypothetical protein VB773_14085 [Haloarculaceae archaeon H-GB2-1]|nr:hypothetical protein [Haloarculaceae archaeon H-GB11]MEA5408586.1 hypothetical protein [Haloarculaceae archaeon H-GB2-1]
MRVLREQGGEVSLDDLVLRLGVREHNTTSEPVSRALVERLEISLRHAHLPKLADAGVIEYDDDEPLVSLAVDDEMMDLLLGAVERRRE